MYKKLENFVIASLVLLKERLDGGEGGYLLGGVEK